MSRTSREIQRDIIAAETDLVQQLTTTVYAILGVKRK
jgi:hypothetical protein